MTWLKKKTNKKSAEREIKRLARLSRVNGAAFWQSEGSGGRENSGKNK